MSYLNNIINEGTQTNHTTECYLEMLTFFPVLRLRPTLSVHGRRANRDTWLPRGGGDSGQDPLLIGKGSYLVYSSYALHRDRAVFGSDANSFRPDRWEHVRPKPFEYLSFGAGPRGCPGSKMAWEMLAFAIARIAQKVKRLEARDDRPWQESVAFSFFNVHGVLIGMKYADQIEQEEP